jgi:hypothetical protein
MKKILIGLSIGFICCSSPENHGADEVMEKITKEHDSVIAALKTETDAIKASIIVVNKDSVKNLLKGLTLKKDEFKQVTFYKNYNNSYYSNAVSIYLVEDNKGEINGRLKIEYSAEDWLFINNYTFLCDGVVYDYTPENDIVRDNSEGEIYEYSDQVYSPQINKIMKAIISSKVAKLRCNGDKYYDDRLITKSEKQKLKKMFEILNYNK